MAIAKPTVNKLDWVTSGDPTKISEPSGSKKTQGWSPSEPLPAQQENWLLYSIDKWQKYFDASIDALNAPAPVAVLGSAAQVTAGQATHSVPQDAYNAAITAGGGLVAILKGTFAGDLNMNGTIGVIFRGFGYATIFSGNITVGGKFNDFLDSYVTGTLTISGNRNRCVCSHLNATLAISNFAANNFFAINRLNAQQQQIVFTGTVTSGTFKLTYNGNESTVIQYTDVAATVQTVLRALPGLSAVTVTGTLGTGFIVTMTGVDGPSRLSVTSNALVTATGAIYQYQEEGKVFLSHSGDNGLVLVETATFNVQPYHHNCTFLVDCSVNAVQLQLPQPSSGFSMVVKDAKGNSESKNITLKRYAAEKIEQFAGDAKIQSNFQTREIGSDGTDYYFF